jgi:hypothetical protein
MQKPKRQPLLDHSRSEGRYLHYSALQHNHLSLQACNTTLNISEVLELQGASYEELEETYNRARQLAQQASSLKLEATVLRGLLGVQKLKGYDALARECSQICTSVSLLNKCTVVSV